MESIISTILIATFSSFITFQFSIARFRSEKWWELKISSYQKIIEALHESKLFSSLHLEAYEEGAEVTKKRKEELSTIGRKAYDEIVKTIDIGSFLLSTEAMQRLKQYMTESYDAEKTTDWYDHLEKDYTATKNCIDDLIIIAKNDLDRTHSGFDYESFYTQCTKNIKLLIQKLRKIIKR